MSTQLKSTAQIQLASLSYKQLPSLLPQFLPYSSYRRRRHCPQRPSTAAAAATVGDSPLIGLRCPLRGPAPPASSLPWILTVDLAILIVLVMDLAAPVVLTMDLATLLPPFGSTGSVPPSGHVGLPQLHRVGSIPAAPPARYSAERLSPCVLLSLAQRWPHLLPP